jgi:hypothetical protein
MIRIRNPKKGPIQLVVRSRTHNGGFTTLSIPGIGGKNYYDLEDELTTEFVERARIDGFITIEERKNTVNEGE